MDKITVEMPVDVAQEVHSSLATLVNKIQWVIENKPSTKRNEEQMKERVKLLTIIEKQLYSALHQRARDNFKIVR